MTVELECWKEDTAALSCWDCAGCIATSGHQVVFLVRFRSLLPPPLYSHFLPCGYLTFNNDMRMTEMKMIPLLCKTSRTLALPSSWKSPTESIMKDMSGIRVPSPKRRDKPRESTLFSAITRLWNCETWVAMLAVSVRVSPRRQPLYIHLLR